MASIVVLVKWYNLHWHNIDNCVLFKCFMSNIGSITIMEIILFICFTMRPWCVFPVLYCIHSCSDQSRVPYYFSRISNCSFPSSLMWVTDIREWTWRHGRWREDRHGDARRRAMSTESVVKNCVGHFSCLSY